VIEQFWGGLLSLGPKCGDLHSHRAKAVVVLRRKACDEGFDLFGSGHGKWLGDV